MKARIGRRAVDLLQLRQQRLPVVRRQVLLAELAQTQDQRPPNRDVRFLVQSLDDGPGVGTQRTQAMDQIAPHPRIGAVLQERPDLLRLVHPEQSHRRIRLPLRQLLLGVVPGCRSPRSSARRAVSLNGCGENRVGVIVAGVYRSKEFRSPPLSSSKASSLPVLSCSTRKESRSLLSIVSR